MSFYASIANFYDYIFPFSPAKVDFVVAKVNDVKNSDLLEIGCGTGNLTLPLAEHCKRIVGVDLDRDMLAQANSKMLKANIEFQEGNMLYIDKHFLENSKDSIICFGNTLVHLDNLTEIELFLANCQRILKSKGKLLLQIINYNRILSEHIDHLPTLEDDTILFERKYDYLKAEHKINFKTRLLHKQTNQVVENEQLLFPIIQDELIKLLENNGFEVLNCFGDFKGAIFDNTSVPLIVEAQKI
jgi:ubiquinone/menaquinone biosynthesis C-methylase UbiE